MRVGFTGLALQSCFVTFSSGTEKGVTKWVKSRIVFNFFAVVGFFDVTVIILLLGFVQECGETFNQELICRLEAVFQQQPKDVVLMNNLGIIWCKCL